MKSKILASILLFICTSSFAENCKLDHLTELKYTDIECQFYMGTTAFRHEVYGVAAAHWLHIVDSPIKYEGDEEIQTMALGTLTFLIYQGLGVKQNRAKAVQNWEIAAAQGSLEARRHLGSAYSDKDFKHLDLVKALGWYESVNLIINDESQLSQSDKTVYQDALSGAKALRAQLTEQQKKQALAFAKSTL